MEHYEGLRARQRGLDLLDQARMRVCKAGCDGFASGKAGVTLANGRSWRWKFAKRCHEFRA